MKQELKLHMLDMCKDNCLYCKAEGKAKGGRRHDFEDEQKRAKKYGKEEDDSGYRTR